MVNTPIKFFNFDPVDRGTKTDYSANAGDQPPPNDDQNGNGGKPPAPPPAIPATYRFTGVVYQRSTVRLAEITDGTSNTLMVGEKHVSVQNYRTFYGAIIEDIRAWLDGKPVRVLS